MNRASKWADINSHIPYAGRVDIKIREDLELMIRMPEWAEEKDIELSVYGEDIKTASDGRYIKAGKVKKGDDVTMAFPIPERTETIIVEKQRYRATFRGNDAVYIDPPGENWPLYQKGHFRTGKTLWKNKTRFVPEKELLGF
jgi:DUF1680 family protein